MKKEKVKKRKIKQEQKNPELKQSKLKKKKIMIIILVIVLLISIVVVKNRTPLGSFLGIKSKQAEAEISEVNINYGNIALVLSSSSLIQDLPKDGKVLLRFYNFDSGFRQWEKSYVLKKGEVTEGYIEDADIIITLYSGYLNSLTNKNFCSVIQTANKNKDLGIDYGVSKVNLLWKFKSMLKYRDCFGF